MPHPLVQEYEARDERRLLIHDDDVDSIGSRSLRTPIWESQWSKTARKIHIAILSMFLVTFVQSAIFPGILTDVEVGDRLERA